MATQNRVADKPLGTTLKFPAYAVMKEAVQISGMSKSAIYEKLGDKAFRAIKVNSRTLIDVQSMLDWMSKLPEAKIRKTYKYH